MSTVPPMGMPTVGQIPGMPGLGIAQLPGNVGLPTTQSIGLPSVVLPAAPKADVATIDNIAIRGPNDTDLMYQLRRRIASDLLSSPAPYIGEVRTRSMPNRQAGLVLVNNIFNRLILGTTYDPQTTAAIDAIIDLTSLEPYRAK